MPTTPNQPDATRPDPTALLVSLLVGDSGLSRSGLHALCGLRRLQLDLMRGSRGAFVKIIPREREPLLDLAQVGRDSPLPADFHNLVLLELIRHFPKSEAGLRAPITASRRGADTKILADAFWQDNGDDVFRDWAGAAGCPATLLAATLFAALKPLYEAVALALARHIEIPQGGATCPACGNAPWARGGARLRCGVCETVWDAELPGDWREAPGPQPRGARRLFRADGARLIDLDAELFEHAFDPGPFVTFLSTLD